MDKLINQVIRGDCLEVMKDIPDKSIDMILCDLPYGTTACSWDTIIPFEPLWAAYKRIIKDNGAIVLTASQPFTSKLVMSNLEMFKYEWIWNKNTVTGFLSANKIPLKSHENILTFCKTTPIYNPIKTEGHIKKIVRAGSYNKTDIYNQRGKRPNYNSTNRYPRTSLFFDSIIRTDTLHPTQKPVALFKYLIKTYTNPGELILDNCAGSGTTAIACIKTDRNYILIEKEKKYIDIINNRIRQELSQRKLPLTNDVQSYDSVFDALNKE